MIFVEIFNRNSPCNECAKNKIINRKYQDLHKKIFFKKFPEIVLL